MSPKRVECLKKAWSYYLPSVKPYYAVKCNPDPQLLQILRKWDFGFDCASPRELELMTNKDDIIYANPCKSDLDLHYAKKHKSSPLTVVDSAEEVAKLAENAYAGGALLRIKVDDTGSKMPFSTKFGLSLESVKPLALWAKTKHIDLHGISFHVGSASGVDDAHARGLEMAVRANADLREAGHQPTIIDIGGGFVPTFPAFSRAARHIMKTIKNTVPKEIRCIAEPGRFFATESQDLFVQVIGKKPAFGGGWRYTIDESLYGQFTNILFDQQRPRWIRVGEERRPRGRGILFGRTCDSLDVIAHSEDMDELVVGDWLWFPKMGAYTSATASEFNGFPKPPVFLDTESLLPATLHISDRHSVGEIRYMKHVTVGDMMDVTKN